MNNSTVDAHAQLIKANDELAHDLIPAMVYLGVLMLLGIVGNGLVCFVFFFRLRMTTQDCLIIALAVFDLLSCFIAMPTEIVDMRYFLMFDNEFACRLLRFIIHYCAFASILTLVVIALDRYMKVCHPLQRQMSLKNVKIALLFILLIALVFAFPATILYGIRTTEVDNLSIPGHDCSINDHVKETVYPLVYNTVLFVAFFLVLVMLTVIYIRIWREMKRHRIYMARNSVAGESRLYLSSASEVSSACEFPPRSESRRRSTLPVENGHDDAFAESKRHSRRKKTERKESGCSGSDSGAEQKLPSVHSDTTFCEGEQDLRDVDDDQQECAHAMDSQSSGDVEKQVQTGENIPVQGLTKANASARIGAQNPGDVEKQFQNGQNIPVHEQRLTQTNANARTGPQNPGDVEKQFHNGQDIPTDSELSRHPQTQASNGTLPSGGSSERTVSVLDETVRGDSIIPPNSCPNSVDSAKNAKHNESVCQSNSKDTLSVDTDSVKQNCFQDSVGDHNSDVKTESIALSDNRHIDSTNTDQTEQTSTSRMNTRGEENRKCSCDCDVDSDEDTAVRFGSEGQSALKNCSKSVDGACVDSASNTTQPPPSETPEDSDTPIPNHEAGARTRSEEGGIHNGDIPPPRPSQPENNHLKNTVTDMAMTSKRKVTKSKSTPELKSHKATVIAMSVTVVFFLSFVPYLSLTTVRTLNADFDRSLTGAGLVLYNIFLRSYFINSVTNPIIYGVLNSRFRVECLYVFRQIVSCGKRTT